MNDKIKVTVWNEFHDERKHPKILELYPGGVHEYLGSVLTTESDFEVRTANFYENDEFGLGDDVLDSTDVLIMYSHMLQDKVSDDRVNKIISRVVSEGMGIIFLHSALWLNVTQRLIGPGGYTGGYREIEEKERVFVVNRNHPITQGLPTYFEFHESEMYGEPGDFPEPDELVFISWYQGGEASRSGFAYHRGAGKVFYFSPGHSWYDVMQSEYYHIVLRNAIRWAKPLKNMPASQRRGHVDALEVLSGALNGGH